MRCSRCLMSPPFAFWISASPRVVRNFIPRSGFSWKTFLNHACAAGPSSNGKSERVKLKASCFSALLLVLRRIHWLRSHASMRAEPFFSTRAFSSRCIIRIRRVLISPFFFESSAGGRNLPPSSFNPTANKRLAAARRVLGSAPPKWGVPFSKVSSKDVR